MKSEVIIEELKTDKDYFPALFANKDRSIIILANERVSEKTFAGVIISINNDKGSKVKLGTYSNGWTYVQFQRLPKGSVINLKLIQDGEL